MKEPSVHRMLPQTKDLIEKDIIERRKGVTSKSQLGNEMWGGGDQWHSTTFRAHQEAQGVAVEFFLMAAKKVSEGVEIWPKPAQTETVEVGHRVKVKLLDDKDVVKAGVKQTEVDIFGQDDAHYLSSRFDGLSQMIIGNISPLGEVLIGRRRGETLTYHEGQRVQVVDVEDAITISPLFDEEIVTD